jgi:hypothetical protein
MGTLLSNGRLRKVIAVRGWRPIRISAGGEAFAVATASLSVVTIVMWYPLVSNVFFSNCAKEPECRKIRIDPFAPAEGGDEVVIIGARW